MRDFTVDIYRQLLVSLQDKGYRFLTYLEFHTSVHAGEKVCVLRHDVDARKENSLEFARIQHALGIKGTYYFRVVPESFDEDVIKEIASLGHEIGYHYETMDTARGDIDKAYAEFVRHLAEFRKLATVKTICMHGSPLSKFDNRDIWKKYDYRALDLVAEPYFDLDFNSVFYITDTGRRWDGGSVSIRDKPMKPLVNKEYLGLRYSTTSQLINSINAGNFPGRVMFTFHPQRWTNVMTLWLKEVFAQSAKNAVKAIVVRLRG